MAPRSLRSTERALGRRDPVRQHETRWNESLAYLTSRGRPETLSENERWGAAMGLLKVAGRLFDGLDLHRSRLCEATLLGSNEVRSAMLEAAKSSERGTLRREKGQPTARVILPREGLQVAYRTVLPRHVAPKDGDLAEECLRLLRAAKTGEGQAPSPEETWTLLTALLPGSPTKRPADWRPDPDVDRTVRSFLRANGWPPERIRSAFSRFDKRTKRSRK